MVTFDCKRCEHKCGTKANLISHLSRKNPCEPIISDIPASSLIAELTHKVYNEKTYDCKFCAKKFNSYKNCWRHHKICLLGKCIENDSKKPTQDNVSLNIDIEKLQKTIKDKDAVIEDLKIKNMILSKKRNEAYYQRLLETYFKAGHKKIGKVGITDITTDTSHIEIKKWDCWKEAIGQLFVYNNHCPRDDLQVHLFGKYDEEYKKDAIKDLLLANIKCYEFQHNGDNVDIVCLQTNDIIHTFDPLDPA
jgi:hypothetical protein